MEHDPSGVAQCRLQVDGLRCAACVWVTEHLLRRTPGVVEATVSYATGRASLRWNPRQVELGQLVGRIAALGYRPRLIGRDEGFDRDLLLRLGVAVFAAANIMLLYVSLYAGWWSGMEERFVVLFQWASLALATPVALWCAAPFFQGAYTGLRNGVLHMDVPIALGVTVLWGHGVLATLRHEHAYLDSLGMLVALLLAGRMLESRGRRRAAEAALSLAASVPTTAKRATADAVEVVASSELQSGDRIDVGAGEEIAADGVVEQGTGRLRMALITGESEPVDIRTGSEVVAGSVLMEGAVTVRVSAVGRDTVLQRMAERLQIAAEQSARPVSSDRIAPWFTAGTLIVATVTFGYWAVAIGLEAAVTRAVAVLVVACPCALALSRPLAGAAGLGAAARRGILFRSADALLDLADIDLVALDKTGTVTRGAHVVLQAEDRVLRIAAGLERYSSHPIARAVVEEMRERRIPLPRGTQIAEEPGVGISGMVDGRRWKIRSGGPGEVRLIDETGKEEVIRLGDSIRSDSVRAIGRLRELGFGLALLTGDHWEAAHRVAAETGIGEVLARVDPTDKADWVQEQRRAGRRVLFAGDGLNDGPALAEADVGVAMGRGGAASSVLVADAVISSDSIAPIPIGIYAARACRRAVRTNQLRSIAYNILAVGAAAAGLVNPLVAAVLMPLSSAMVIWGASRVEAVVRRQAV